MRRIALLAFLLPLAACTDGLGTSTECAAEMAQVRRQYGPPSDREEGITSAIWFYDAQRVSFTFSWAGGVCTVRGPVRFSRAPVG